MSLPARDADPRVESPGTEAADAASSRRSCAPTRPGWPSIPSCIGCWRHPCGCMATAWPTTWRRCCRSSASAPMTLLAAGRAAAGLAARVQDAVLALLRSTDPADCVEPRNAGHPGNRRGAALRGGGASRRAPLPTGTVARLLDGRQVVFRDAPSDARLLHAEAAGLAAMTRWCACQVRGRRRCSRCWRATGTCSIRRTGPVPSASSAAPWPLRSAAEAVTGEAARQAFLEWLGQERGRPVDGRGLRRRHRRLPRLSDPASWRRARSGGARSAAAGRFPRLAGGAGDRGRRQCHARPALVRGAQLLPLPGAPAWRGQPGAEADRHAACQSDRCRGRWRRLRRARSPSGSPRCPMRAAMQARDTALFTLLYGCGLRIAEALALDVRDAPCPAMRRCAWSGKGAKQRIVPVLPAVREAIAAWLALHPDRQPDSPLFRRRARRAARSGGGAAHAAAVPPAARPAGARDAARVAALVRHASAGRRRRICARSRNCWGMPACPPRSATRRGEARLMEVWRKAHPRA